MVRCFQYPIDSKMLIRKKNRIKKELLERNSHWIQKRVAVLGGSTTNEIVDQLELFLLNYGIKAEFYQSDFGKYWEEGMFGTKELDGFRPDIVYIHTSWRNVDKFPEINFSKCDADKLLENEAQRFRAMWQSINDRYHCPIIQNNFDRPNYRLLGNRDIWDYRGRSNFLSRLNQNIYSYAQEHENFYINDLDCIAQEFGLSAWSDPRYWYMYKYAMSMDAIPFVAESVAKIVKSIYGRNKKVLALDLDNTLWGGVVGDDGVEGIIIGPENAKSQAFYEFQKYCKQLKDIGVVLVVDSKNEMENALAGLNHPDGILRPSDFVDIKANWNTKDRNLKEIAEELTLGTDSFVFVDDNPAEREIVSGQIPGVAVPIMDTVENYIRILDHNGYFEVTTLSQEDIKKTEMYHAKVEASKELSRYVDYDEYLDSLQMKAYIEDFKPIYIQRIAQLTNKSNQFNLTTLRCSEDDIRKMKMDKNNLCLCGRLEDKFADNGLVTVVLGEVEEKIMFIRLWLMSCRVLKRGMEDVMMNVLVDEARDRGIQKLVGYYYPTEKNAMVKDFYELMGFIKKSEDKCGNAEWELTLNQYTRKKQHMEVFKSLEK